MTLVAFHVIHQARSSAGCNYGGLEPAYWVLVDQGIAVAPQVVIAQTHGYHTRILCEGIAAGDAERHLAVAAQAVWSDGATLAGLTIFRAANDAICALR